MRPNLLQSRQAVSLRQSEISKYNEANNAAVGWYFPFFFFFARGPDLLQTQPRKPLYSFSCDLSERLYIILYHWNSEGIIKRWCLLRTFDYTLVKHSAVTFISIQFCDSLFGSHAYRIMMHDARLSKFDNKLFFIMLY